MLEANNDYWSQELSLSRCEMQDPLTALYVWVKVEDPTTGNLRNF